MVIQECFLTFRPEQPYLTGKLDSASQLALDGAAGWTGNAPEVPANLSDPAILPCCLSQHQTTSRAPVHSPVRSTLQWSRKERPVCDASVFFHRFTRLF